MFKTKTIYKRNFSKISTVQEHEQIIYNLCITEENTASSYGIEIISKKKTTQKCQLISISDSKSYILEILTFLYENSIKPDTALGIISDIFTL